MDKLKIRRNALRKTILKISECDIDKASLKILVDRNDALMKIQNELCELLLETKTEEEYTNEVLDGEQFNANICKIIEQFDETEKNQFNNVEEAGCKARLRLPKLELKEFDLSPKNYLKFWAQYGRIYEDPGVRYDEKYHYLLMSVKGKAREIVEAYPHLKIISLKPLNN